jgi:hypothetical protein
MNDLEVVALDLQIWLGWNPGIDGVARMLLLVSLFPILIAVVLRFKPSPGGPMRTRLALFLFLVLSAFGAAADDQLWCGTSDELEERLRAKHERRPRFPVAANAAAGALPATLRDGAFYMQADEQVAGGGNLFDLAGRSLVFEPRPGNTFATRRVPSLYAAPGDMLHDFTGRTATAPHYVTYDLTNFPFPIFGRNVTRLYLTAFNEIEFDVPNDEGNALFDELAGAVHRNAVLSPLMITNRKPRQLAYPQLFVRETATSVFVTWKSVAGETFGYDVQAELRSNGTIVYSYNSMREMQWGTPLLSAGFNPAAGGTARRSLHNSTALPGVSPTFGQLGPMLDIRNVETFRMGESDLLAVRVTLGEPIDLTKIGEAETLRYTLTVSNEPTYVEVKRSGWTVYPFGGIAAAPNGAAAHVEGNTVEFYLLQSPANVTTPSMRVFAQIRPSRTADTFSWIPTLDVAPRSTGNDLSSVPTTATELATPIVEAFRLPGLDPYEVWERIQPAFHINKDEVDAVAIYQSFYTDMIFYAGAYAIVGNAGVNGIGISGPNFGPNVRRGPNLMHMNHFTYNYNTAAESASQVILHEFGHRWLYFFRFANNGEISSALNPISAHPAAYVSTPAAFPVFTENESSVMGGAVFMPEGTNTYRTRVANRGYSWMDLYLMGLASASEVAPWYYLTGTTLRAEYWPDDNVVVTGDKHEVKLDQVVAVHGERFPSAAYSQKKFKVLFVLVTEPGKPATDADVAKMNEWRANFERTFYLATGGRGGVETAFVQPGKKRATR